MEDLGNKGFSDLSLYVEEPETESGVEWIIYLPYPEPLTPTPSPTEIPFNDNGGFVVVEKPID